MFIELYTICNLHIYHDKTEITNKNKFYAIKFKLLIASFLSEETIFFQIHKKFSSPSDIDSIDVRKFF